MTTLFPGVFRSSGKLMTLNLVPGYCSHSEEFVHVAGREYRVWEPSHSKPAAAMAKGLKTFPLKAGSTVLYLGAANGNTVSFFSDIVGLEGVVYAVEISPRSMHDLAALVGRRKNVVPILANAKLPASYGWVETVDVVYQDVATADQSDILVKNAAAFLRASGHAMIAIKSRSIDVTREPADVYAGELAKLKKHFTVLEAVELDPFEKDHLFAVLRRT